MQIKTDDRGSMRLYNAKDEELDMKPVKSITFHTGNADTVQFLTATIEVYLTNIDVVGHCSSLKQDINLFTVCPICGKKRKDCEHTYEDIVATSNTLCVRDQNDKGFGYVQKAIIQQNFAEDAIPFLSLYKYEKTENGEIFKGEDKQPFLFYYSGR